jgi:hypothetical protein
MHCYNERPETTEHPSVQAKGISVYGRGRQRCLRACVALCLTLLALQVNAVSGSAAPENPPKKHTATADPAPARRPATHTTAVVTMPASNTSGEPVTVGDKPLEIDVTKPQAGRQYVFAGNGPRATTDINFNGDGHNWSLITFESLPVGVQLKVRGKPNGYDDSEPLKPRSYYPFKTQLPVVLEIQPGTALNPVGLGFSMGKADPPPSGQGVSEVRDSLPKLYIVPAGERQVLSFSWNAPANGNNGPPAAQTTAAASPNQQGSPSPSTTPTPESSWWTYLTEDYPVLGVVLVLVAAIVLVLFLLFALPWVVRLIQDIGWFQRGPSRRVKRSEKIPIPTKPTTGGVMDEYESLGGDSGTQAEAETLTTGGATEKESYSSFRPKVKVYGAQPEILQPDTAAQGRKQIGTERDASGAQSDGTTLLRKAAVAVYR